MQVLGCGWVRVRVRVCVCMCVCMCWAAGGCDLRALLVHGALVYSSRPVTGALEQGIRRRQADLADHLTAPTRPDRPGQTNLARSIRCRKPHWRCRPAAGPDAGPRFHPPGVQRCSHPRLETGLLKLGIGRLARARGPAATSRLEWEGWGVGAASRPQLWAALQQWAAAHSQAALAPRPAKLKRDVAG